MEEKLRKYLEGRTLGSVSEIRELADGNGSNHHNYKVITSVGAYVARIVKQSDVPGHANLSDEYVILKLVEKWEIGPKAIAIDLEDFETPLLIEEFLDGVPYSSLSAPTEEVFEKAVDLLIETSTISISNDQFPFKFSYGSYETSFRAWDLRLKEIEDVLVPGSRLVSDFNVVARATRTILSEKDTLLRAAPKEFIYNDVHPGNVFWLAGEKKAKFIDWQKVSIGNPAFMAALFSRRFGYLWSLDQVAFSKKVFEVYQERKSIKGFEDLFRATILERAVSDMIWSVWADVRKKIPIKIDNADENKYYAEVASLLSEM